MHAEAYAYVQRQLAAHPVHADAMVVEIGGRNVNGTIRDLFGPVRYLATDIAPGPGVDLVADGATLVVTEPADIVVCCEVLEHAANAAAIVANMARIAGPGGRLLITAAGAQGGWARAPHSAIDGGGLRPFEYYANVAPSALEAWLQAADCEAIEVTVNPAVGDVYATAVVRLSTIQHREFI